MASTAVVVEDESDISGLITAVLESCGYRVHSAADGLAAVDLIRDVDPDLTTLDVNLPGIDGLEVARRVREFSDTYIIFISALVEPGDAERARAVGGDEYLGKPFRPRDLRARATAAPRRSEAGAVGAVAQPALEFRDIGIQGDTAHIAGAVVVLSAPEAIVLRELVRSQVRRVEKSDLARALRGERDRDGAPAPDELLGVERVIESLRGRLAGAGATTSLESVHGSSYRLSGD